MAEELGGGMAGEAAPAGWEEEAGERMPVILYGGGQAVRLPAWCRFEGTHVRVRREGERMVLEPLHEEPRDWPEGFWDELAALGPVSDSYRKVLEARRAAGL